MKGQFSVSLFVPSLKYDELFELWKRKEKKNLQFFAETSIASNRNLMSGMIRKRLPELKIGDKDSIHNNSTQKRKNCFEIIRSLCRDETPKLKFVANNLLTSS